MATKLEKIIRGGFMGSLIASVVCLAAWVTHVVVCIKSAAWFLLLIGAFFFPVGIIHGVMVWFGVGMV